MGGSSPVKKKAGTERLTEREEDEILLQEEMGADEGVVVHLQEQPPNIAHGTMREYQLQGLNWLIQLYEKGLGGILADEMGLGKTLQTISLLAYLAQFRGIRGPHLVIVPLSTLGNWCNEFARWCPSLSVLKFHGTKEERKALIADRIKPLQFDVCVTTYEMAIMEKGIFARTRWKVFAVDEAHRLKNEASLLSQIVRTFQSRFRLLVTGTPLQNNLHELWALLNFLIPKQFGDSDSFDEMFASAGDDQDVKNDAVKKLHGILRPIMLRRLKSDVEKRLLPKVETLLFVGMTGLQRDLYKKVATGNIDVLNGNVMEKRRLLNIVMQLRKCANHPYLFDGVEDRSLDPFGDHLITNSGKMVVLDKLLPKLKNMGSRVLIFSQMTRCLDILEDYCAIRDYQYCRIDGSTATADREEQMVRYNAPNSEKFLFLLSTRSGGLGINLYTADIVILFDSDWNPQMDLQAQDRAHRIGQKKQVKVYRFITEHSIEEKIIHRAEVKLRLDALVVQQGRLSAKHKNLTQKDMLEMIRYGADKVFRADDGQGVTDEDIDLILQRGEQKTNEFNEKLKKHVGMKEYEALKFDGSTEDAGDGADGDGLLAIPGIHEETDLDFVNKMAAVMPKRERRRNYNEDSYFRHALTAQSGSSFAGFPKPRPLPRMESYQFYDSKRLQELHAKTMAFWEANKTKIPSAAELEAVARGGLTEDEVAERERLLSEGFKTWNKKHFYSYRQACADHGRTNAKEISLSVAGKTPEEVLRYHAVFQARCASIPALNKLFTPFVQRGEQRILKRRKQIEQLEAIPSDVSLEALPRLLDIKYGAQQKGKGFSLENDYFLLHAIRQVGYGKWDALRLRIRQHPSLVFDFFMKSRSAIELERRVDVLLRLLLKNPPPSRKRTIQPQFQPQPLSASNPFKLHKTQ